MKRLIQNKLNNVIFYFSPSISSTQSGTNDIRTSQVVFLLVNRNQQGNNNMVGVCFTHTHTQPNSVNFTFTSVIFARNDSVCLCLHQIHTQKTRILFFSPSPNVHSAIHSLKRQIFLIIFCTHDSCIFVNCIIRKIKQIEL